MIKTLGNLSGAVVVDTCNLKKFLYACLAKIPYRICSLYLRAIGLLPHLLLRFAVLTGYVAKAYIRSIFRLLAFCLFGVKLLFKLLATLLRIAELSGSLRLSKHTFTVRLVLVVPNGFAVRAIGFLLCNGRIALSTPNAVCLLLRIGQLARGALSLHRILFVWVISVHRTRVRCIRLLTKRIRDLAVANLIDQSLKRGVDAVVVRAPPVDCLNLLLGKLGVRVVIFYDIAEVLVIRPDNSGPAELTLVDEQVAQHLLPEIRFQHSLILPSLQVIVNVSARKLNLVFNQSKDTLKRFALVCLNLQLVKTL